MFFKIIDENRIDTIGKINNLTDSTIRQYIFCHRIFIKFVRNKPLTKELVEENDSKSKQKKNQLGMLRLLYPELSLNIKFPKKVFKPKILSSETELQLFFNNLPDQYKPIFILLRGSGLRISELLNANIDTKNKMIVPQQHTGQTKHCWISFYKSDIQQIPKLNKDSVGHAFLKTSKKIGIKINPHLLRSVFVRDMSKKGMPSHYIDVFQGRVPQSVLARSYTDYSVETLKEISVLYIS